MNCSHLQSFRGFGAFPNSDDNEIQDSCITHLISWRCFACQHLAPSFEEIENHFRATEHEVYFTKSSLREAYCSADKEFLLPTAIEPRRKPTGLKNLKNTCFINSAVQVLAKTQLSDYLKFRFYSAKPAPTDSNETKVAYSFARLVTIINSGHFPKVIPTKFFEDLCNVVPMYSKKKQQDTQEFIRILLDTISTAAPDKDITEPFRGLIETQIQCGHCEYRSTVSEPFLDLTLQIPEVSLQRSRYLDAIDFRIIQRVNDSWTNLL